MIYLQMKCLDLEALLRFIYLGECEVEQENIDRFLSTARKLGIEGLATRERGGLVKGEGESAQPDTEITNQFEEEIVLRSKITVPEEN